MKLIRWNWQNLHMPMMEDDNKDLFCTSKSLCGALGLEASALRHLINQHRDELDCLSVNGARAKEFFQRHRIEFGILRVRQDMHLWSEDDMVAIAMLSRSEGSKEFRKGLRTFVKQNALKQHITREEYDALVAQLEGLQQFLSGAQPSLQTAASAAGQALQAQKKIRHLRRVS